MQLKNIDKARYRKHLNKVIWGSIAVFASSSLIIAQVLINLFPDADGSHFHWNLTGVVIGGLIVGLLLNKNRNHPFMTEVTYVWELKQTLNKITRKLKQLKTAAEEGNVTAMTIVQYSYSGSRLLWKLDDNTIVMDELAIEQAKLDALAEKYNVTLDAEAFDVKDLELF